MSPRIQCTVVWIGLLVLVLQSLAVQLIERPAHVVGVVVDELRHKPAYRAPNPARVFLNRLHDRVVFETAHLIVSHGHPHHLSPRALARTSRSQAFVNSSSNQQLGSSSDSRVVAARYLVAALMSSRT